MYNDIRNKVIDEVIEGLRDHDPFYTKDEVIEFVTSMKQIDPLKAQVITIARELLDAQEEDIRSGIEQGMYDRNENFETLATIKRNRQLLDTFEKNFFA